MIRRRWTAGEDVLLCAQFPGRPSADVARDLGRTEKAVHARAHKLGLRKSAAYLLGEHASQRDGRLIEAGAATRFHPGHGPWNAGLKGWDAGGRSVETRFKPGEIRGAAARNWRPFGAERTNKEGILQRKVAVGGRGKKRWQAVHVLLWESHHGPVPRGHIVVFRNGDRSDIRLDNLELISRAENMRRNSVHRLPKELAELCQLKGALQRCINERTEP